MNAFVVDTNVAVVANGGLGTHASDECQLACIAALLEAKDNGIIILDDGGHILNEYKRHLSYSGQPGVGDLFFAHVHDNQATQEKVCIVTIRPVASRGFHEFPNDPALVGFDADDRMFVAAALSSKLAPEILNAVDTDWADFHTQLTAHGLHIKYLCPDHAAPEH